MFQVFGVLQKRQVCAAACLQVSKKAFLRHERQICSLNPADFETASAEESAHKVIETDSTNDSFLVTAWQDIIGIPVLSPLTIRAMMHVKINCLQSFQSLPPLESIISFAGDLLTVQNDTAFVAVDDHSYFPSQNDIFDINFDEDVDASEV